MKISIMIQKFVLYFFVMLSASQQSCSGLDVDCYKKTLQSGVNNLKWAKQMEQWYDSNDIDHFITHYGFDKNKPKTWNSVAYLNGRYVLKLVVKIEIDYDSCSVVKPVGAPEIFFGEVKDIEIDDEGQVSYSYVRNVETWPCDPKVWDMLERKNGDLSALPFAINKDKPLRHFKKFREAEGKDIISGDRQTALQGDGQTVGNPHLEFWLKSTPCHTISSSHPLGSKIAYSLIPVL